MKVVEALSRVHGISGRRSITSTQKDKLESPTEIIAAEQIAGCRWEQSCEDDSERLARFWARFVVRTFNQVAWKIF